MKASKGTVKNSECRISHLGQCAIKWLGCGINALNALAPFASFVARVLLAKVFFDSGKLKLPAGFLGIGEGNWDNTIYLFKEEYQTPFISPELAAYLGTGIEIIAPFMLIFGVGTRAAALALLGMTLVIEFTYQHSLEHYYWASLALIIATYGAGKWSADHMLSEHCTCCPDRKRQ